MSNANPSPFTSKSGGTDPGFQAVVAGINGSNQPTALQMDASGYVKVNIAAGSASGTEYTEGDTDASISGGAIMWEDTSDTLRPVSAAKPLPVNIVAGSSSGTEYTEGDTDASITGTAVLMEGAANALVPLQGTAADGLLVNLGANNDVTVTGTVQVQSNSANLATQTTAAAIQTSVELIDDTVAILGTTTYTEATTKGLIMGAVRRDADTTLANTTNEITPLQVDANGYLKVEVFDGGGTHTVDAPVGTPVFVRLSDGSSAITTLPVSLASVPSHAVTNAGTFAVQDSQAITDNAGFTDGTSKVYMGGFIYDEVAGTALTENDAAAARINVNRAQVHAIEDGTTSGRYATVTASNALKVDGSAVAQPVTDNSGSITVDAPVGTPVFVTATPSTTGGWSPSSQTALTNSKVTVKGSAGNFGGYMFYNPNSSAVYIQVWDVAAASVTVGTTAPTYVIPLPATQAANIEFSNGIKHDTAIVAAATTTATGSTAPSSSLTGFFLYK